MGMELGMQSWTNFIGELEGDEKQYFNKAQSCLELGDIAAIHFAAERE